ncbi:B-cell receptor CD22-like [Pyxicephalus adspersus]|uniref:B-cell receptor CD22-like n=1 Tax=Pyxicephalus adspersus TaxID=30357 RepID=UPI003B5A7262
MFLTRFGFLWQRYVTTIVIMSMIYKGSNSQFQPKPPNLPGFTINVPRSVTVQHNLCVHIPCSFQIPPFYTLSRDAAGIWLKGNVNQRNIVARKNGADDPQNEYPRFFLTGEVWKKDCSLRISDAEFNDDDYYTFVLEEIKYPFLEANTKVTVIDLKDTPEISPTKALVPGQSETLTCTSPGRCSGKTPKITWQGTTTGKTILQYSVFIGDGIRTYHSNLTFVPNVKDSLEILRCVVTFADGLTSTSENITLKLEGTDSKDKTDQVCSSMKSVLVVGIIVGNLIILLLMGLGLFCYVKRQMKRALTGNRPHESRPQGTESTYQDLYGQSIHIYDKIIRKIQGEIYDHRYSVSQLDLPYRISTFHQYQARYHKIHTMSTRHVKMKLHEAFRMGFLLWIFILLLLWKGVKSQSSAGNTIQVQKSATVQEGLCITIPCTFTANKKRTFTNATGFWITSKMVIAASSNPLQTGKKTNFLIIGDPNNGNCTLIITSARKEDLGTYFFRFMEPSVRQVDYINSSVTLQVTDLNEKPKLIVPSQLIAGQSATLTCVPPGNCPGKPPAIQWKKSNVGGTWNTLAKFSFTPTQDDHRKSITCEVTMLPEKKITAQRVLNIDYPPANMEITVYSTTGRNIHLNDSIIINEKEVLILNCSVEANPPARFIWKKQNDMQPVIALAEQMFWSVVNITEANNYTCSAINKYGTREATLEIKGIPQRPEDIIPLSCECSSMSYAVIVVMVSGNVIALILIALGLYCFIKRRKKKNPIRSTSHVYEFEDLKKNESVYQKSQPENTLFTIFLLWKGVNCQSGNTIQVQKSATVQEGLCMTIPCTFTANDKKTFTNATGFWITDNMVTVASTNPSETAKNPNFIITGDPNDGNCTLTITSARKENSGSYFFRFTEPQSQVDYADSSVTLLVTDLTEKPKITVSSQLIEDQIVILGCVPPGNCAEKPTIQWRKSNVDGIWKKSSKFFFKPTKDDHQNSVTCEVTMFPGKTITAQHVLNVDYSPNIEISVSSSTGRDIDPNYPIVINKTETLIINCSTKANPPAKFTWKRNLIRPVNAHSKNMFWSTLKIIRPDNYTCSASNNYGTSETILEIKSKDGDLFDDISECESTNHTVIAWMVTGNIIALLLIALGLYCFFKRREKEKNPMRSKSNAYEFNDPKKEESVYQDLSGQANTIYHTVKYNQEENK